MMRTLERLQSGWALVTVAISLYLTLSAASFVSPGFAQESPPIFRGYSGQFIELQPVEPAPSVSFLSLEGDKIGLDKFRGKVVLLNFWATWCAPCRYEMPSLDKLAAATGGTKLVVLAVSIDRAGLLAVAPYLRELNLTNLSIFLDPEQSAGFLYSENPDGKGFPLYGLPISYIIDTEGRVRGYLPGAANWNSKEAQDFLLYFER